MCNLIAVATVCGLRLVGLVAVLVGEVELAAGNWWAANNLEHNWR